MALLPMATATTAAAPSSRMLLLLIAASCWLLLATNSATALPVDSRQAAPAADSPLLPRQRRQTGPGLQVLTVSELLPSGSPIFSAAASVLGTFYAFRDDTSSPAPAALDINPSSGLVSLRSGQRLDFDVAANRAVNFVVRVWNSTGSAVELPYRIDVQPANDEMPVIQRPFDGGLPLVFRSSLYQQTATKAGSTVRPSGVMSKFIGADADSDSSLSFALAPGTEALAEGRFRIVSDLGYLVTVGNEAFTAGKSYRLAVQVQDSNADRTSPIGWQNRYGYAPIVVSVDYQNPQLAGDPVVLTFPETTLPGQQAGVIRCASLNNIWSTVRLTSPDLAGLPFTLAGDTGILTLTSAQDYDKPANEKQWRFSDVAFNDTVLTVAAIDADTLPNKQLRYSLTGAQSSFFYVETDPATQNALIKVLKKMDYESLDPRSRQYEFGITVTDGLGSVARQTASVIIPVANRNDKAPVISNGEATISKTVPVDSIVYQLQAQDGDNSDISYYFNNAGAQVTTFPFTGTALFRVEPTTGQVKVASDLRGVTVFSYTVPVIAVDSGTCPGGCPAVGAKLNSAVANLSITISDANLNAPVFRACPTSPVSFREGLPPGSPVSTVDLVATDADTGSNGRVVYSLVKNDIFQSLYFSIDANTAALTSTQVLDREFNNFRFFNPNAIWLTVQARDEGTPSLSSLCTFQIVLTDVNDNAPEFDSIDYTRVIMYNVPTGTEVIRVFAYDPDAGNNAVVNYRLVNTTSFFQINKDTTTQEGVITVQNQFTTTAPAADNPTLVELIVEAFNPVALTTGGVAWPRVVVRVFLTSNQDLLPPVLVRTPPGYQLEIMENANSETNVLNMTASLPSLAVSAKFSWSFVFGSRAITNPSSGQNFRFADYNVTTQSNQGVFVGSDSGYEHNVTPYLLLHLRCASNVKSDKIGEIYTDVRLNITISDTNNRAPLFFATDSVKNAIFPETFNQTPSTRQLVSRVAALDYDTVVDYRTVTYSLASVSDAVMFDIDANTGELFTRSGLVFDREARSLPYAVTVEATDRAASVLAGIRPSPNKATLNIRISLSDINDNPPVFNASSFTVGGIPEDTPLGRVITQVTASDADLNPIIQYQIVGGNPGNTFGVKFATGEIYVARPLDYDEVPNSYSLVYVAFDGIFRTTATVTVSLSNVVDFRPTFGGSHLLTIANISENASPGQMQLVQPSKTDSGSAVAFSSAGYFALPGSTPRFEINPSTGMLSFSGSVNRINFLPGQDRFRFNAIATDRSVLRGYLIVEVLPIDANDKVPIFLTSSLNLNVTENTPIANVFATIKAYDPDLNSLTYNLLPAAAGSQEAPEYVSLASNGELRPRMVFDYENPPPKAPNRRFQFRVLVSDGLRNLTGTVTVHIQDASDTSPSFVSGQPAALSVSEAVGVNDTAVVALAQDADVADSGRLQCSLSAGSSTYFRVANVPDIDGCALIANDNSPVINPATVSASLLENAAADTLVTTLSVTDADSVDTNFTIYVDPASDPYNNLKIVKLSASSARVLIWNPLDREIWNPANSDDAVHAYSILALDGRGGTGTATISLTIRDVNDSPPRLVEPYSLTVLDSAPSGTVLLPSQMFATDPDKNAANSAFTYQPVGAAESWARFDLGRGVSAGRTFFSLSTKVALSRDSSPYLLPISITDPTGGPVVTATVTVTVVPAAGPTSLSSTTDVVLFYNATQYKAGLPLDLGPPRIESNNDVTWDRRSYSWENADTLNQFFTLTDTSKRISLKSGTGPANYTLTVTVTEASGSATATELVRVYSVPQEALDASTSMLVDGLNGADFVEKAVQPVRLALAAQLGTLPDKVLPVSVSDATWLPGRKAALAFFVASGSPFYTRAKMDFAMRAALPGLRSTMSPMGASVVEAPYSPCRRLFGCPGGCSHRLSVNGSTWPPPAIRTNSSGLVGISLSKAAVCGACSSDPSASSSASAPVQCAPGACRNNGTCVPQAFTESYTCQCRPGFDGPNCQRLQVGFNASTGYLMTDPLDTSCRSLNLSFSFLTSSADGILLYTGPYGQPASPAPSQPDFLSVHLVTGKLRARIDLGSGPIDLAISGGPRLDDSRWHRVDLTVTPTAGSTESSGSSRVALVLDQCTGSGVDHAALTNGGTAPSLANNCLAEATPAGLGLDTGDWPVQIGGRYQADSSSQYPTGLPRQGVVAQLAQLRVGNQLIDLVADNRSTHSGAVWLSALVEASCSASRCGPNGFCWGAIGASAPHQCDCKSGWVRNSTSGACDVPAPTLQLGANSYAWWRLQSSFVSSAPKQSTCLSVQFRSRQPSGVLLKAQGADPYRPAELTLRLRDSRLVAQLNTGDYVLREAVLPNSNVSDGGLHTVRVCRSLQLMMEVMLDSGEGINYATLWGSFVYSYNYIQLGQGVIGGASVTVDTTGSVTVQPPQDDLQSSCLAGPLVNSALLPADSAVSSPAAELFRRSALSLVSRCSDPSVGACPAGATCPQNQVCLGTLQPSGSTVCGCLPDWTMRGDRCYASPCFPLNPCQNGGYCIPGGGLALTCRCLTGFSGSRCEVRNVPVFAVAGAGIIVAVVLGILVLVILLALLVWWCRRRHMGEPLLEPDKDTRENVVAYDEDGAGEEDTRNFDLQLLRVPNGVPTFKRAP
uniref:Cadherin domain-containing protein n=1 Tax=Macrostomum lignano TaxID=282301 RepID=A0A1I8GW74_9PLAT